MLYPLSYEGWAARLKATGASGKGSHETPSSPSAKFAFGLPAWLVCRSSTTAIAPRDPARSELVAPSPTPGVPVLLSPGVIELEPALSRELGPGFSVQTEGPGADGVMIVGPLGPAAMAFLRASHPDVVLLVVDRRWHVPDPNEAVIHLEAGADGYLASPVAAEVASHVRALVRHGGTRRRRLSRPGR